MRGGGLVAILVFGISVGVVAAQTVEFDPPAVGSVSQIQGLEAFQRIYEVVSHPRCANCHVGPDNLPMWSGPSYGETRPHGMNIAAGDSRIGAEFIPCATCHTNVQIDLPHSAPAVADEDWQLAPVEFQWFGKSAAEICAQLRDPDRNGDRNALEIAEHVAHSTLVNWGWTPGGGRQPAPYRAQLHIDDVLIWGVAGMPCPAE